MKKIILVSAALSLTLASSAFAKIESWGKEGPFSDACVKKIISAIDAADKKGYIGDDAFLADLDDVEGGEIKEVTATVNEADYTRGYSIWSVKVRGTNDQCQVLSAEVSDVAT